MVEERAVTKQSEREQRAGQQCRGRWSMGLMVLALLVACAGCAGADAKEEKKLQDAEWHYKMGAGYFESHEIPLAIRELTMSLEMNPKNHEAHHLLALIYMGRREYAKSQNHFLETLRIKPDYHIARNNLGSLYLAQERWREAEEEFKALLDEPLYPTPELVHNNLGWTYFNLRKYSKALQHYKMATFLKPQLCLAHNGMGLTLQAMGDPTGAVDSWQLALERCPTGYAEPHYNLGKVLQGINDPRAVNHFRACAQIEPHSSLGRRCREYLGAYGG